ncbi:cyst wall protein 1 [Thecamonas trahens ATCC 50062]|uniref:Cyst wall protein 1 n=1 Tax=Thecamonas trahens ATCC 50062 TaxID=461836 RepID=A0A0L0DKC2_THETB|nr:cyst wall protein 1 [Thecamonas trahens ATCC 50062]KNC51813.1 cyst wall protein 1 [Thecamonas trahens ATCC 50062]|eukprot:XP_013755679.1 cyst wall protein 1 [Thecamonas trahens ATCC 50062]
MGRQLTYWCPRYHYLALICFLLLALALPSAGNVQLDALKALYDATGGKKWRVADGWSKPLAVKFCDGWTGVVCDGNENVVALELAGNNLVGQLPSKLGALQSLVTLNLSSNALDGSIPPGIGGSLEALNVLDLSDNALAGPIPQAFAGLVSLSKLWLAHNKLTGSVPDLSQLPLVDLDVAYNKLDGETPDWMACSGGALACDASHNPALLCQSGCGGNACAVRGCECSTPCQSSDDCAGNLAGCFECLPQGVCGRSLFPPPPPPSVSPPAPPLHPPPTPVVPHVPAPPPPPSGRTPTRLRTSHHLSDVLYAVLAVTFAALLLGFGTLFIVLRLRRETPLRPREYVRLPRPDRTERPGSAPGLVSPSKDEFMRLAIRERATEVNTRYNAENYFAPPRPRANSGPDRKVKFAEDVKVKIMTPPPSPYSSTTSSAQHASPALPPPTGPAPPPASLLERL